MGNKGYVSSMQAKALLNTSKFIFWAKSIVIIENAFFFPNKVCENALVFPNKVHYKEIHSKLCILRNTNC